MIEIASARSSRIGGSGRMRQDQDDEDRQHADREPDVAALEQRADLAEPREAQWLIGAAGRAGSGHVGHE